jgi:ketosteroid isomerase-like protein
MKRLFLVVALVVLAAGASAKTASSDAEAGIRRANSEVSANVHASNAQAIVDNYYAPDAVAMAPNLPAFHGRDAIRKFWVELFASGAIDLTLTSDNVTQSGNVAVEMGHYDLSITPAGGQAIKDNGKYLVMWKKTDGRWWAVEDIFNSDIPLPK